MRRLALIPVVVVPVAAAVLLRDYAWPIGTTVYALFAGRRPSPTTEADPL